MISYLEPYLDVKDMQKLSTYNSYQQLTDALQYTPTKSI